MSARLPSLLCALLLSGLQAAQADDTVFANGVEPRWIAGYHVGYQRDLYPLPEVDFSSLTHLMVGRATPNPNGSINTHFDIDTVNGPIWAQQVASAARAAGVKAVLMVGGAGEYSGWVGAAAPANRPAFVANLLAAMDNLGFDGLDLDWEPLQAGDEANFLALAQALRTQRPNIILSVPVGWVNANFAATPNPFWRQAAPLFDRINVMSYDMAGAWDGWASWHSSALAGSGGNTPSSVETSLDYYRRSGVPRARLGMGLPFYGTCWRGVSGPGQAGGWVVASDNTLSYRNIVQSYYSPARRQWDAAAQVPYLAAAQAFGPQQCTFLSYDDEQSVAAKGAWLRRNGYAGTIIWTIGQGYFAELPPGQRNPLLQAVKAAF